MAASIGARSPSTSPRLPSPPPIPEVQIGLKSPPMNALSNTSLPGLSPPLSTLPDAAGISKINDSAVRRIRPGTRAAEIASGPPLIPLAELDSPFQLQEYLKSLYYHHTKSDRSNTTMALSHDTAVIISTPPEGVDRSLWLYELCRLLVAEVNNVIVAFFNEDPPCSSATCHEMRASEWQYLCAVHDPPKSCCAIDYCCHTLDWAANVLTSQKNFPSRLTLGSETAGGSQQGLRQLTNIFRRVYRIFAHAWFQHRASFWDVEGKKGLYLLFKTVCDAYSLIPEENYTISPEAEGITTSPDDEKEIKSILKKPEDEEPPPDNQDISSTSTIPTTISSGATTRRHKHTPSTGASVTTIAETDEDDPQPPSPQKENQIENPPETNNNKSNQNPITSLLRTNSEIHRPLPPPESNKETPTARSEAEQDLEKTFLEPMLEKLASAEQSHHSPAATAKKKLEYDGAGKGKEEEREEEKKREEKEVNSEEGHSKEQEAGVVERNT